MSKHFPECPLPTHNNCTDFYNPKICAIVRKRKVCLRKRYKSRSPHVEYEKAAKRIKDQEPEIDAIVERDSEPNKTEKQNHKEQKKTS